MSDTELLKRARYFLQDFWPTKIGTDLVRTDPKTVAELLVAFHLSESQKLAQGIMAEMDKDWPAPPKEGKL